MQCEICDAENGKLYADDDGNVMAFCPRCFEEQKEEGL